MRRGHDPYDPWRYYFMIERRVLHLDQYVCLAQENKDVFSDEITSLLITTGVEIDNILRRLCDIPDDDDSAGMRVYRPWLRENWPKAKEIWLSPIGTSADEVDGFWPFECLHEESAIPWWKAYTNLKHNRHAHRQAATLWLTLDAIGALYLLAIRSTIDDEFTAAKGASSKLWLISDAFSPSGDLQMVPDWRVNRAALGIDWPTSIESGTQ